MVERHGSRHALQHRDCSVSSVKAGNPKSRYNGLKVAGRINCCPPPLAEILVNLRIFAVRLAEFILANVEPILAEWAVFARSIWPGVLNHPANDPATLRDHAEDILRATAEEMASAQTPIRQSEKSKGAGRESAAGVRVNRASERHGFDRGDSGFELWAVVAEYRALRASVIRLWRESGPVPDLPRPRRSHSIQ